MIIMKEGKFLNKLFLLTFSRDSAFNNNQINNIKLKFYKDLNISLKCCKDTILS